MTPVERLVANGNAIIQVLNDFAGDAEQDISLSWINDDDTVTIRTFPNIKKFQAAVNIKLVGDQLQDNAGNPVALDAATVGGYSAAALRQTSIKFKLLLNTERSFPLTWMAGVTTNNEIVRWGDEGYGVGGLQPENIAGVGCNIIPQPASKIGVDIVKLVSGTWSLMVLYADGDLYSIGMGVYGQLGIGNTSNYTNLQFVMSNIVDITTSSHGYYQDYITYMAIDTNGELWTWGRNALGQCGNGNTTDQLLPGKRVIAGLNVGETIVDIYANGVNGVSTYVLTSAGRVFSCGYNPDGELGLGDLVDRNTFQLVSGVLVGKNIVKLCVGGGTRRDTTVWHKHSVIALADNGVMYCWGNNTYGQLGLGNTTSYSVPTQMPLVPNGAGKFVDVVCCKGAELSFMAITDDGELWGWGANNYGCLGFGASVNVSVPARITLANIGGSQNNSPVRKVAMACGATYSYYHTTLIITEDGRMFTAGRNSDGQCGNNTTVDVTTFNEILSQYGNQVQQISSGGYGTTVFWCLLLDDGRLISWGTNTGYVTNLYRPEASINTPQLLTF